ncbi:hypothetical protein TWF694_000419 [Orbilia ellipsospora]|uniref:F-box domain-containing protein n=1 Tax=Orbilia ellipsospora TaxID=2528407 RepID=A0AAV9XRX1_9PEZI
MESSSTDTSDTAPFLRLPIEIHFQILSYYEADKSHHRRDLINRVSRVCRLLRELSLQLLLANLRLPEAESFELKILDKYKHFRSFVRTLEMRFLCTNDVEQQANAIADRISQHYFSNATKISLRYENRDTDYFGKVTNAISDNRPPNLRELEIEIFPVRPEPFFWETDFQPPEVKPPNDPTQRYVRYPSGLERITLISAPIWDDISEKSLTFNLLNPLKASTDTLTSISINANSWDPEFVAGIECPKVKQLAVYQGSMPLRDIMADSINILCPNIEELVLNPTFLKKHLGQGSSLKVDIEELYLQWKVLSRVKRVLVYYHEDGYIPATTDDHREYVTPNAENLIQRWTKLGQMPDLETVEFKRHGHRGSHISLFSFKFRVKRTSDAIVGIEEI